MFGFIADALTNVTSILFPVFASYKAIRTSDPAALTPWLMYWTTLSLFLMVESQFNFILSWVPFYSWMRFGLHLYLVLPGKQGSVYLYQTYVHPFLEEHERHIDRMISEGHAKAKAAGLDIFTQAIEYVRVNFLGQAPKQATPPPGRDVSYATNLLNRFTMPAARAGAPAVGSADLLGLLGKALAQATSSSSSTSRDVKAADLNSSGNLIPQSLTGSERSNFINTQREQLKTLLKAFDNEAYDADGGASSSAQPRSETPRQPSSRKSHLGPSDSSYMHKSHSESEFEDLAYEPMPDPDQYRSQTTRDSSKSSKEPGWSGYLWGNYGEKDSAINPRKDQ